MLMRQKNELPKEEKNMQEGIIIIVRLISLAFVVMSFTLKYLSDLYLPSCIESYQIGL